MLRKFLVVLIVLCFNFPIVEAGIITGRITDLATGETLIGASVTYAEGKGISTDIDGNYSLSVPNGLHQITVQYIGYKTQIQEVEISETMQTLDIALSADDRTLANVTVVGEVQHGSEVAATREQQESPVAMTSVSEQQIKRTQDKNAGEIMRRIPGVSLIDEKFVMVRGLSQRYNNVWLNGCAVPSSEADQRAFSFDIIPSAQIDNLKIVKAAAPDYPADFTGGFVLVNVKDVPLKNSWGISLGGSYNSETHFHNQYYYQGSSTDLLGFDSGKRTLAQGIHSNLISQGNGYSLLNNGLNNDWTVKQRTPIADMSLSGNVSHRWLSDSNHTFGLNASFNYSNNYRSITNMQNNLFGAYDVTHNCSNYLRKATDNQYSNQVRLGGMLGLVWLSANGNHRLKIKQIINQMGKSRYTNRCGFDAQSDYTEQAEYYYQSRTTYNAGLSGNHIFGDNDEVDWNVGYAYANRNLPDRRRYTLVEQENGAMEVENLNDINREFSFLGEHIYSASANWKHTCEIGSFAPKLKVGAYGEQKNRKYTTRFFTYAWPDGQLPQNLRSLDVTTELLTEVNYGADGFYLLEQVDWTNNYEAQNILGSAYISLLLPFLNNNLEAYGGLRFESFHTELVSHTKRQQYSPISTYYDFNDLFPSLSLTYHLTKAHQLRMGYGRTTNRPEFRELSTSVYYDFDLASNVQGNYNLAPAYIENVDLGWEWYPHAGEVISVSLFYKYFKDPIEWTYTVAGGTDLVYSYMNADKANTFGMEIDVRKQFDFLSLPQWSLSLNASLIQSKIGFPSGSSEQERPMQGQSPYLINAGLFYNSDLGNKTGSWQKGWTAGILYNTIGKRIIGVGRSVGNSDTEVRVPDSYEMSRHQIDMNVAKSFGPINITLSLRDVLNQQVQYIQFEKTTLGEIKQVTRAYRPGRTISLSIAYKL